VKVFIGSVKAFSDRLKAFVRLVKMFIGTMKAFGNRLKPGSTFVSIFEKHS